MFDKLKEKLKERKPFITYTLRGIDDCLCIESDDDGLLIPLKVDAHPPSISYVIGTKRITTLILRHSETYQKTIAEAQEEQLRGNIQQAEQIVGEVVEKVDELDEISMLVKLGGLMLIDQAIEAYHDESQKGIVKFVETEVEAKAFNDNPDNADSVAISTTCLEDMELMNVGLELISAIPTDMVANVPIMEKKVQKISEKLGDKFVVHEKEVQVQSSVPADKSSEIPRHLRTHSK